MLIIKCFLLIGLSIFGLLVYAAKPIDVSHQPMTLLKSFLSPQMISETGLQEKKREIDFNRTTHIRLQQSYRGYAVWGADVILHTRNQTLPSSAAALVDDKNTTMNGLIYQHLQADLENTPDIVFQTQNKQAALQQVKTLYQDTTNLTAELIVYVDEHHKAHWAYYIGFTTTTNQGIPSHPMMIMDAISFEIYQQWDNIQTLENVLGGGFGGNKKVGKWAYDGLQNHFPTLNLQRDQEHQICYLQNTDVIVKDARFDNAVVSFPCALPDPMHENLFWNGELNAINGAYSPDNDALYVGQIVKDMYQNWYHIPVLTENDKARVLNIRVHADMENAYWDGEQITFGDGSKDLYPLVSLGIAAHEISHGFTEQHANLIYFGQSGGLNESFSDMAAQAAEFYVNGSNTWQMGYELIKEGDHALRYMNEPTKDCEGKYFPGFGCSIDHVKDYHIFMDVHFSSGIFNKVFYLISTAQGWDTKKAFDIMVQANQYYWTPLIHFNDAACGVIKATKDFNYSMDAVIAAFKVVGINANEC